MYGNILAFVVGAVIARVYLLAKKDRTVMQKFNSSEKLRTAIIIGSGGHTAEMLRIVNRLSFANYSPRYYVMASSDTTSANQVLKVENDHRSKDYKLLKIPRSRHVGQGYVSSLFTTVLSTLYCIPLMLRHRPRLILCNGPGTCIPICLIAYVMKVFFLSSPVIVFVESVCRVKTLSLTGYILYYFVDLFFVQWPDICKKYSRSVYVGRV